MLKGDDERDPNSGAFFAGLREKELSDEVATLLAERDALHEAYTIQVRRAEEAEAKLRQCGDGWEITEEDVRRVQSSDKDSIICKMKGALAFTETTLRNYLAPDSPKDEPELLRAQNNCDVALSSSTPCPHSNEARRLEQFIEKRLEQCVSDQRGAYQDVLEELRRAGKEERVNERV